MEEHKPRTPILLLDVDGVLNPYPTTPAGFSEYEFFPEDDEPVRLCADHAGWLRELAGAFEIAWASSWGGAANEFISATFDLPAFPIVALPPVPFEPREKVPAVAAFAGSRPAAWVDDILGDEAWAWAAARPEPTLLVEVQPAIGLGREHVDRLLIWAHGLSRTTG